MPIVSKRTNSKNLHTVVWYGAFPPTPTSMYPAIAHCFYILQIPLWLALLCSCRTEHIVSVLYFRHWPEFTPLLGLQLLKTYIDLDVDLDWTQQEEKELGPCTNVECRSKHIFMQWMVNTHETHTLSPASWPLSACWQAGPRSLQKGLWHHLWQWYFHLLGCSRAKNMNRANSARVSDFPCGSTSRYCTNSCVHLLLENCLLMVMRRDCGTETQFPCISYCPESPTFC